MTFELTFDAQGNYSGFIVSANLFNFSIINKQIYVCNVICVSFVKGKAGQYRLFMSV